jgi:hypothetical protein
MEEITPPIDLSKLESLPLDLRENAILELPLKDIAKLCRSSRKLNNICKDKYFWKKYMERNIPIKMNIPEDADINWYKLRIKEYPEVKKWNKLYEEGKINMTFYKFNNDWDLFERIENAITIKCNNLQLTNLPPFFLSCEQLDCSFNNLTELPSMPNILNLDCDHNIMTALRQYSTLLILNCSYNQLISLPHMPNLWELICNFNNITFLSSYPKLRFLNCNDNKLIELSEQPELERLYCQNNNLSKIPYLPNLKVLHAEDNNDIISDIRYWRRRWPKPLNEYK